MNKMHSVVFVLCLHCIVSYRIALCCVALCRFETQEECLEFMRRNVPVPSNPEEPHLNHCITMLVTWSQVERYLLPRREQYLQQYPMAQPDFDHPQLRSNRWLMPEDPSLPHSGPDGVLSPQPVHEYLTSRLDLPIHQVMSTEATMNTLKYMFFHLRSGIYVMIRQGRLMMFVPFVNKDYRNTWGDQLQVDSSDGSLERYYAEKREAGSRLENYIPDKNEWWANGNIVCNEHCKPGTKLLQLYVLHLQPSILTLARVSRIAQASSTRIIGETSSSSR